MPAIYDLLRRWLAFASDVQPGCAAGADLLDWLRNDTSNHLRNAAAYAAGSIGDAEVQAALAVLDARGWSPPSATGFGGDVRDALSAAAKARAGGA